MLCFYPPQMVYNVPNQITVEKVASRMKTLPYFCKTIFTFDKKQIIKVDWAWQSYEC